MLTFLIEIVSLDLLLQFRLWYFVLLSFLNILLSNNVFLYLLLNFYGFCILAYCFFLSYSRKASRHPIISCLLINLYYELVFISYITLSRIVVSGVVVKLLSIFFDKVNLFSYSSFFFYSSSTFYNFYFIWLNFFTIYGLSLK